MKKNIVVPISPSQVTVVRLTILIFRFDLRTVLELLTLLLNI